jgi:ankyrin repeat protein
MLQREKAAFREALEMPSHSHWIQIKNKLGMTLLHFAVRNGDIEATKILIENNADPSYAGGFNEKQTPLHCAVERSYFFAIYLKILIKNLKRKDLTALLMEVLPENVCPKITLPRILQQITLQQFESILWQVLAQSRPEEFSPRFQAVLTYVQTQMQVQGVSYPKTINTLMGILEYTNDLTDFNGLLKKLLSKVPLRTSFSVPTSPRIHSSSPIFGAHNFSEEASLDEFNSDLFDTDRSLNEDSLAEDSFDASAAPRFRRGSIP